MRRDNSNRDFPPRSIPPEFINTESELDELLTLPSSALVEAVKCISSPLLVLGAGGKMGPTLAVLAQRAAIAGGHPLEVVAVSRFREAAARSWLEDRGVKTLSCDLLDAAALARLPDASHIIYLAGQKFGTNQNPASTWAVNILAPARICERFPGARVVALSTGNVYPLSEVGQGGATETAALTPLGEYANAAVGRERIFEYYARLHGNPVALIRLNYAVDLRYGVLVDIARLIYSGQPVCLETGCFNCIWQGDANDMILRALPLAASPPSVWNLCLPETFSTRQVATRLGELLGRAPLFSGSEAPTALLSNSSKICAALGPPAISIEMLLGWVAHWVRQGGRNLEKPTHFDVRNGQY